MVLEDLGNSIKQALSSMASKTVVDEEALKECLNGISRALMSADVNIRLVKRLVDNVKGQVKFGETGAGLNRRKVIEKAVFDELVSMLDPGGDANALRLTKGKQKVVMFVGLQGAGKTTTIMKYAHHYKTKGFKPCMVCADTFRAGAFDQLKQNATKIGVPFFGDYTQTDPALIARSGVEVFREQGRDLILVDTSGRHRQQEALFEEMRQVAAAVSPDLVIFVMDGSIGQAAQEQAQAFRDSVDVGAVVLTKMDGHAKGGGALSAVAATRAPIIFIGTGEHTDQLESFDGRSFVGKLLGIGDIKGLVDRLQEAVPESEQEEMMERLMGGSFTLRLFREQLSAVMKMGPMSQVMGLIPGMSGMTGMMNDQASQKKLKTYFTMMDSMTDKELDQTDVKKLMETSRIERIGRGAGVHPMMVAEMLDEFKRMSGMMSKMKDLKLPKKLNPDNMRQVQQAAGKMAGLLPPNMLQSMGGVGGLGNLMKQVEKMAGGAGLGGGRGGGPPGGMGGLEGLMQGMGGMGGMGGMNPQMMQKMMKQMGMKF